MYVQFIFAAIFIGYAIGSAPIIGYHYGAGNHLELKSMLRKSLLLMGGSGAFLALLAQLLATPLARLFVGYDAQLFQLTVHAFRLFSFSFVLAGFNVFASSFFTALSNGGVSAAISFLRTLVFQLAALLLLPALWGIDGVWLAVTAAELAALAVSVYMFVTKDQKFHYRHV